MAIVSFPGDGVWIFPPISFFNPAPASTASPNMNASGDRVAWAIQIPKTGTLDHFEFLMGAVSNQPDNGLRFSFQNLDASGFPDGTQDQFRDSAGPFTANAWTIPSTMTNDGTGGGVKRSVTKGDRIGCVIDFVTFVAGDNLNVLYGYGSGGGAQIIYPARNYSLARDAGTWFVGTNGPIIMALVYDDTSVEFVGSIPSETDATISFSSGSTPDERGMIFQVPIECQIRGAWVRALIGTAACDMVLYDSDGTTALATVALAPTRAATGENIYVEFPSFVTLDAATNYRLTMKPAGVSISLYEFTTQRAALLDSVGGGQETHLTTRTDAGAWTQTTTRRPYMGILISGFETGGGGGGGEHSAVF